MIVTGRAMGVGTDRTVQSIKSPWRRPNRYSGLIKLGIFPEMGRDRSLQLNQLKPTDKSGWSGFVESLDVFDFIQLFVQARKTKVVRIISGGNSGVLIFENGALVHASTKNEKGVNAVIEMVTWGGGAFEELEASESNSYPRNVEKRTDYVLLEAARALDESEHAAQSHEDSNTSEAQEVLGHDNLIVLATVQGGRGDHGSPPFPQKTKLVSPKKEHTVANINLKDLLEIDGFLGTCLVDSESGMILGLEGGGGVDLEVAAAGNTQVVQAKLATMESLKLKDTIEDILITLSKQYHLIRPLSKRRSLFLYLVLDRKKSNLAMARHNLRAFEETLEI